MELKLGDVQTTALIPLAIKANETLRKNARVSDPKAVEIIKALKIHTQKYDKFMSHEDVIARTIMLDRQLKEIIRKAPETVVVNIGAGFDNRFSRVDNGKILWFGPDGGYSFINALAEDNALSKKSLVKLEGILRKWGIRPKVITGHTGWSDDLDFVFAHKNQVCNSMKKQKPHDPNAPYDGYDEREDTEFDARNVRLAKAVPVSDKIQNAYRSSKNIYDDV